MKKVCNIIKESVKKSFDSSGYDLICYSTINLVYFSVSNYVCVSIVGQLLEDIKNERSL